MAKLRGSINGKLYAIRETLMLAVVTGQDHADLIKLILGVVESIDKNIELKARLNPPSTDRGVKK